MNYAPAFAAAEINKIHFADALDLLAALPPKSVDMFLLDLPYGTTDCAWDSVIPFAPMWKGIKRAAKDHTPIVCTASMPFTAALWMSNPGMARTEWIWFKGGRVSGQLTAKYHPLKVHESVLVFAKQSANYYPIMTPGPAYKKDRRGTDSVYGADRTSGSYTERYPTTELRYAVRESERDGKHGTPKPVALFRYLIETYSRPGDLVVDFCAVRYSRRSPP